MARLVVVYYKTCSYGFNTGLVMTSIKSLLIFSLVIFQLAGCASVLKGVKQEMTFKSDPAGATVFVDGLKKGQTPLKIGRAHV